LPEQSKFRFCPGQREGRKADIRSPGICRIQHLD
jgi:hypothetical protein